MRKILGEIPGLTGGIGSALAIALLAVGIFGGAAWADEADAKRLLKAMSDYVAGQSTLAMDYDATLEVVTKDQQKLAIATSGSVTLSRPDKLHANRDAGFASIEMIFDGKTLTLLGKTRNRYLQAEIPGSTDNLMDVLHEKYNAPLPAADLLMENPYELLMEDVVDIKDLGSGFVGGVECDHLAFRNKEVDWQIWIAHGDAPYPCRYSIASKLVDHQPQYTIQVRNWKVGESVSANEFTFVKPEGAEQIGIEDFGELGELPNNFTTGD